MTDKPQRIQRQRTRGWRMPENTVYVGRGSKWGNPFRVGQSRRVVWLPEAPDAKAARIERNARSPCVQEVGPNRIVQFPAPLAAADAVRWFAQHLRDSGMIDRVTELRGRNLACWCPLDRPCHADLLLELANTAPVSTAREGRGDGAGAPQR